MADFTNINLPKLGNLIVGSLRANHVAANLVTRGRDIDDSFFSGDRFSQIGDTMTLEVEPELEAKIHNPSGNEPQSYAPEKVDVKLDKLLTVDVNVSTLQRATVREKSYLQIANAAAKAIDKKLDEVIISEAVKTQYFHQQAATVTRKDLLQLIQVMNGNLAPYFNRSLIMDIETDTDILSIDSFLDADKRGDGGAAFREAVAGRALGILFAMDQNCKVARTPGDASLAVNKLTGYAIGDSVIIFDGGSDSDLEPGDMISIAGEDTTPPYHVVKEVVWDSAGVSGTVTLADSLIGAVADDAVITVKKPSQAVAVQKSGLVFGMRPLAPFNDGTSTTIVTPDGYSIRMYFDKDGKTKDEILTVDCLAAVKILQEKKIVRYPKILA